jgi:hypothetical protein
LWTNTSPEQLPQNESANRISSANARKKANIKTDDARQAPYWGMAISAGVISFSAGAFALDVSDSQELIKNARHTINKYYDDADDVAKLFNDHKSVNVRELPNSCTVWPHEKLQLQLGRLQNSGLTGQPYKDLRSKVMQNVGHFHDASLKLATPEMRDSGVSKLWRKTKYRDRAGMLRALNKQQKKFGRNKWGSWLTALGAGYVAVWAGVKASTNSN